MLLTVQMLDENPLIAIINPSLTYVKTSSPNFESRNSARNMFKQITFEKIKVNKLLFRIIN